MPLSWTDPSCRASCPSVRHERSIFFASAYWSRYHVFLGRPFFLLPYRFPPEVLIRDVGGPFRRMWPIPIHFYRRSWMPAAIGLWLSLCHGFSLMNVSSRRFQKFRNNQVLTDIQTLCVIVLMILHISAPYNRTDCTLVLHSLFLVLTDKTLNPQMFLICRKSTLALFVLLFTPAYIPPCMYEKLPRYVIAGVNLRWTIDTV